MLFFGILLIIGALIDFFLTGISLVDMLVLLSGCFMLLMKSPLGNRVFPEKTGLNMILSKMIIITASIAIVVVPLSFVKGKGSGRALDAILSKSAELVKTGEYDKALKLIDGVDNAEEIPELCINKAAIFIHKGDCREAEALIGKAAANRNNDSVLLFNTGLCFFQEGHYKEAASCFEMAVIADPEMWQSYYYAGEVYYKKKDYRSAEYFYSETLKLNSENPEVYYSLARTKMDKMEFEAAKGVIDKARKYKINEGLERKISELEGQIAYYIEKTQKP